MLARRTVLRGLGLSVLAVGSVGLLDGCGGETSDPGDHAGGSDLTLASSDLDRSAPDPAALAAGVASMHALGSGLWGRLAPADGNLAISPFSVAVALGMTANGAVGGTLDEMLDVLSVDSVETLDAGYNATTQHVESLAGPVQGDDGEPLEVALDAANALFGQAGFTWKPPFLDALAASYGAGVQQVDFAEDTETARVVINDRVGELTRDKIPELIPDGALDAITRLVLVNTLYLKAPWAVPFEKERTADGDFHLAGGTTVQVPMMQSGDAAQGLAGEGWTAARLVYAGRKVAMTVVLPDAADGLDALASDGTIATIVATPGSSPLVLTMPRWTFRSPSRLAGALGDLGMPTAFVDGEADFSGMTDDDALHVGAVVHEVFIAVDEAGTEAAAATAVVMAGSSAVAEPPPVLVLDRPFLFVIHDVEHGAPLFVGRVSDPS